MNQETQLNEIEISMDSAKRSIEVWQSLNRLLDNKDFKVVITDGYFKDEAVRLVGLKADPNMQTADMQKDVENSIRSISELRMYFRKLEMLAKQCEMSIADLEQAKEAVLAEGV